MRESIERRQAQAASVLQAAAQRRVQAQAALRQATGHVRDAVLAARAAGISVRRAAELGEVSPDTVNEWVQQGRAEALDRVRNILAQAADPARRGVHLGQRYPDRTVPCDSQRGGRTVRLYSTSPMEQVRILTAAFAAVLAADPALAPDPAASAAAAEQVMTTLGTPPAGALVGEVVKAADYGPIDQVTAPLDHAARLLLAAQIDHWQAALLPYMPGGRDRSSPFVGIVGARQVLDAVLALTQGTHAPGTRVILADGAGAVVTEVQWDAETGRATGYRITPATVGQVETVVPAEQITAIA